jgi:hypothetical protein
MNHEELVQSACEHALVALRAAKLNFRPMQRRGCVNTKRSFVIGRTNLKTGLITIDIFTPRKREPKKLSSILRVLSHEVAHHQKPPYRQFYRFRWICRQHYPKFYKQVKKNILVLQNDEFLKDYF